MDESESGEAGFVGPPEKTVADLLREEREGTASFRVTGVSPDLATHLQQLGRMFASTHLPVTGVNSAWAAVERAKTVSTHLSPVLERIASIVPRLEDINRGPERLPPGLLIDPAVKLHATMLRENKEKRARDEEQIAILRGIAVRAERNEEMALAQAAADRKSARNARVVALLSAFVTVIVSWESIQKFFFFIVEKLP
jgi:hypothetical protein